MIKMSEEMKYKASSWMTFAFRGFLTIGMAILLKSVPIFIYDLANWQKDIEDRSLTSVEMRIDLERHMAVWTLENQASAFARLAQTEKAIIELRKADKISAADRDLIKESLNRIEKLLK